MMRNLLFKISYDGTNYHGFQSQNGLITIQGVIEKALSKLTNETVIIYGCGRTDAGVHAINSYFNVKTKCTIPCEKFPLACCSVFPQDITVMGCCEVPMEFHARYNPKNKTYIYRILNRKYPDALEAKRSYFCPVPLDVNKMKEACQYIIGEKDFRAFMSTAGKVRSTVRNITELEVDKTGDIITIKVTANGFLYNMVRIIVGTLVHIGHNKKTIEQLVQIIENKKRDAAGFTAPPHGLYLYDVFY